MYTKDEQNSFCDAENVRTSAETTEYLEEYVTDTVSDSLSRVLTVTRYEKVYEDSTISVAQTETGNASTDKTQGERTAYTLATGDETQYIYGNGLISERQADLTLYHHYNNLGSIVKLTDAKGNVVASYTYGAYGELLSGDRSLTRFLYNGQCGVMTEDNGLYYMRQRYYNPEIKRFVNQDVVRGELTNSQSLNRYSYVQGNPVSFIDPFGLSPIQTLYANHNFDHIVLAMAGGIPFVGAIPCAINSYIYWKVEGDETKGLMWACFAGAQVFAPFAGTMIISSACMVGAGFFCYCDGYDEMNSSVENFFDKCLEAGKSPLQMELSDYAEAAGSTLQCFAGGLMMMTGSLAMVDAIHELQAAAQMRSAVTEYTNAAEAEVVTVGGEATGASVSEGTTALAVYDPEFAARQLLVDGETSEEQLRSIIPQGIPNTFVPTETISEGYKYNFKINGKKIEIKWHSEDLNAASNYPGSNSGSGWTAQIKIGNKLLGQDGNFYRKARNVTHIPLKGGE
ncbi:MAG: hypothetical protein IJ833_01960 [Lachnospiraceae bacterium]|nr:hypothetical protein [Lachnospiraceae bacterium]